MSERTGWDRGLSVTADGRGLVGHAGAVLLRKLADRVGLTRTLAGVMPSSTAPGWRERAALLVQLAVAIVLGVRSVRQAEQWQLHHQGLFGTGASDSTVRRMLAGLDQRTLAKIAKMRARVRNRRPVIEGMDRSRPGRHDHHQRLPERRGSGNVQGQFRLPPAGRVVRQHRRESGMELRAGNAGANTVEDHLRVLAGCLEQIPHSSQSKLLVRVDGAGATHGLLEHLEALNTTRRTVRYTVGWKMTPEDEAAIAKLPGRAWETSLAQDGHLQEGYQVAELTGLNTREGWPQGMRLIVRRVRPSRRQLKNLTDFEKRTGWRYSVTATNIRHMWGIAGSHQIQFLDALHRDHAEVEDRIRTNKAMGLHNLPSQSWQVNTAWMLAANLAADLHAWLKLLTLHDQDDLADAEPETMRFRLYHLPARLACHARRRFLRIERTWPWATGFTTSWRRLTELAAVT